MPRNLRMLSSFGFRHSAFRESEGFTILEVLIGIAILSIVSSGMYVGYASVLGIVQTSQYTATALSLIESRVEEIRNMRYEDVGTVGGVPAGLIPQSEVVAVDNVAYTLRAYIRNIDDPFDGQIGGAPNDTTPADYKLVEVQVTCDDCPTQQLATMTTWVAPKNLESSTLNGSLFVKVFDADGIPVPGATVHVTNPDVVPTIDVTDITNTAGMLQLVDTATSSAGYHITATKSGYSSDQTYPYGSPVNPVKPDATVATQQLTNASLAIDRTADLTVRARTDRCTAVPGLSFSMTGAKLIGTDPDTVKYSQVHATDAQGTVSLADLEWDSYAFTPQAGPFDLAGAPASLSLIVDPAGSYRMTWLAASGSLNGLNVLVTVNGGSPVDGAEVRLTGPGGYDRTLFTGRSDLGQTDWSGGAYAAQSGINAGSSLVLAGVSGSYATGSFGWLESDPFDLGSSSTTFTELRWNGNKPPQTTVRFQLAANNGGSSWTFVGPDGTPDSYFTTTSAVLPGQLSGNRYLRYRVELATDDTDATPEVHDVTVVFGSGCLVGGQTYFNGLSAETYTLTVTAPGYQSWSGPVNPSLHWSRSVVTLTP